jgi:hypothetical protein
MKKKNIINDLSVSRLYTGKVIRNKTELDDILKEANKLGISYGKYKALLSSPQLLKEVIEARGIDMQKCSSVLEMRKKLRETEVKI